MSNLKMAAEAVRRASMKRGDSILAMINPAEAALLKKKGGSGATNPVTGVKNYYDPDGPRGNDNDNESDGPNSNSDGPDSNDNSDSNDSPDSDDSSDRTSSSGGWASGMSSGISEAIGSSVDEATRDALNERDSKNNDGNDVRPSQAAFGAYDDAGQRINPNTNTNVTESALANSHKELKNPWQTLGAGLLGFLRGGLPGAAYGAYKAAKTGLVGNTPGMEQTQAPGESNRGDNGVRPQTGLSAASNAASTGITATSTPETVTSVVDQFTAEARKKMGRQSQIHAGNYGTNIAPGKKLTGA